MEIARWACELRYEDIPDRVVEECKSQALSVLAATFAGAATDSSRKLTAAMEGWGGGPCSTIPGGAKAFLTDALTVNSAHSIALDYDDYMIAGHTGHSSVLVPLALSEIIDVTGKEFIVAQTIANEIEARIGASVMLGPLNGQMWSFIHAAGAALATSRLLDLDIEQTNSALGIALSQPNRPTYAGFARGDAKLLTAALPISQGVNAARYAQAGLKGVEDILENKSGFCAAFSYTPILQALGSLGKTWLSDTLSYKIYPGCAYMDAPLDCVFEIMKAHRFNAAEVERIDIHSSVVTQQLEEFILPFVRHTKTTPMTLNFYTPYCVAAAVIDGKIGAASFTEERIADPAVWALARKVRIHHDVKFTAAMMDNITSLIDIRRIAGTLNASTVKEMMNKLGMTSPLSLVMKSKDIGELIREGGKAIKKLTETFVEDAEESIFAADAQGFKMAFGARMTIQTSHGEYEYEQEVPYGAAGWNLEEKRLATIRKFEKESAGVIPDESANNVFDSVLALETLDPSALRSLVSNCKA